MNLVKHLFRGEWFEVSAKSRLLINLTDVTRPRRQIKSLESLLEHENQEFKIYKYFPKVDSIWSFDTSLLNA